MSRFPQLAIVLSLTACESLVPPESAPTTPKPAAQPKPAYFQTRAGPKWGKRPEPTEPTEPPRVRVVQEHE
jgi:hypothetical protein